MMKITGAQQEMARLRKELADFEFECVKRVRTATRVTLNALLANTPVWSGETAGGYAIGLNAPPSGIGTFQGGPPGNTRKPHPMSGENNRSGAEAASRNRIESVLMSMTKLRSVHFGNSVSSDKWNLVDSGMAPNGKDSARNPAGIQKPAETLAKAQLGGDFR